MKNLVIVVNESPRKPLFTISRVPRIGERLACELPNSYSWREYTVVDVTYTVCLTSYGKKEAVLVHVKEATENRYIENKELRYFIKE